MRIHLGALQVKLSPTENKNHCNTGVFGLLLNKWDFFLATISTAMFTSLQLQPDSNHKMLNFR